MEKYYKHIIVGIIVLVVFSCSHEQEVSHNAVSSGWEKYDSVMANIKAPEFPDVEFIVTNFSAKADNKTNNKQAFEKAIAKCSESGGGKVIVPAGEYICNGPIVLKSNVNFHMEDGAVIKFSTDPNDYLPVVFTRWEGVELYNYSPLIYSLEQENIAITGKGILDGQASADNWWAWKGWPEAGWKVGMPNQYDSYARPKLLEMNDNEVPVEKRVFGNGYYLRPNFIQLINCKNILLQDVTFLDSPMWTINPVLSQNITVDGVTVKGLGPNIDGCDPESCKDVLINNCYFQTGDDCIAIKSGRNYDGWRIDVPSENIIVQNCKMLDGHGGVVMGSEISGNCRNVFVQNCEMDSPNLERAIRLKSNTNRGGTIENVFVRNITVGEVREAVLKLNMKYDPEEVGRGDQKPVMRNVELKNVTSEKSQYGLYLDGLAQSKIKGIRIIACKLDGVDNGNLIINAENVGFNDFYLNGEEQ